MLKTMNRPQERFQFDVPTYRRMARTGILPRDAHVELLDGEIITMSPIGPKHILFTARLQQKLVTSFGDRVLVIGQSPIQLSDYSEPEPDIYLVPLERLDGELRTPTSEDAVLVIEVSDSTLRYDRTRKLPSYARAGVQEAWIVNLGRGKKAKPILEVYRKPNGDVFDSLEVFQVGQRVELLAFAGELLEWWS
jgi:Uma2 family endonuclease